MQLLVFWTKFSAQHISLLAEEGCPRHQKPKDPFRFVVDGVVSSARLRRPAELTTITASRYCARASRPSAPLLRLRPIGLALRALLCEEGNMTHSSSVQTATSSTFGCGSAALCLFVANHQRKAWPGRAPVGCPSLKTSVPLTKTYFSPLEGAGELNTMISAGIPRLKAPRSFRLKRAAGKPASF